MILKEEIRMKINAMPLAFTTFGLFVLTEIVSFPPAVTAMLSLAVGVGGASALFLAIRQHG